MSFIIACILIFVLLGVKAKDQAAKNDTKKYVEVSSSRRKAFEDKYVDNRVFAECSRKFDELSYGEILNEVSGLLEVAPRLKDVLYFTENDWKELHKLLNRKSTKKEREELAANQQLMIVKILMAKRGKLSRSTVIPRFIEKAPENQAILAYKWFEETLIKGGMNPEDAKIAFFPFSYYDTELKKSVYYENLHMGQWDFIATHHPKDFYRRLYEIDHDLLMSQKYEEDKLKLIDVLNQILELEKQTCPDL